MNASLMHRLILFLFSLLIRFSHEFMVYWIIYLIIYFLFYFYCLLFASPAVLTDVFPHGHSLPRAGAGGGERTPSPAAREARIHQREA